MGKTEPQKDLRKLFQVINNKIEEFGDVPSFTKAVSSLKVSETKAIEQQLIDIIIFKICEIYQVTKTELLNGSERGAATQSRRTAMILFRKHLKKSLREVGDHFGGRDEKVVRNAEQYFSEISPTSKIKEEREFFENFQKIDAHVVEMKKFIFTKYSNKA